MKELSPSTNVEELHDFLKIPSNIDSLEQSNIDVVALIKNVCQKDLEKIEYRLHNKDMTVMEIIKYNSPKVNVYDTFASMIKS